MTANTTGQLSDADRMRWLIDENNSLQRELTSVTAELKEVTQQRDALHPGEGRVVVELPEPSNGDDCWYVGETDVHAYHTDGVAEVYHNLASLGSYPPAEARQLAVALLAAADLAEQKAKAVGVAVVNHG